LIATDNHYLQKVSPSDILKVEMPTPAQFRAIVAVGGTGRRLSASLRVKSNIPKSFRLVAGKPALYWTLRGIYSAGVEKVTICGQSRVYFAANLARQIGFREVEEHHDGGLGFHGLPAGALRAGDNWFFLIPGHCGTIASDYARLATAARPRGLVTLQYSEGFSDPRTRTLVTPEGRTDPSALAAPYAADRRYLAELSVSRFSIRRIVDEYAATHDLIAVPAQSPIEFDVAPELDRTEAALRCRQLGFHATSQLLCALNADSPVRSVVGTFCPTRPDALPRPRPRKTAK
jgi:hypothetical protein